MSDFVIYGGKRLKGEVNVDCCKNAILPIIAASIMCDGVTYLKNCPMYTDVKKMCDILKILGSKITYSKRTLVLDNTNLNYAFVTDDLTKDIRASIFTLGPMLARFKKAKICYPGGCAIGQRGIGLHTSNLEKLGVDILEQHGYLYCKVVKGVKVAEITLDIASVGATENLLMFASIGDMCLKIRNAAKEPEIVDLANFLNKMGAKIVGAGSDCIEIFGVEYLRGIEYEPIADRIIAGTYLIAGAITQGDIVVKKCNPKHIESLIKILEKSGCEIETKRNSIHLVCNSKPKAFCYVETLPYPGFPTDLQSQLTALGCVSLGTSIVCENIFECRFRYVPELIKMGAKVDINNKTAIIHGKDALWGAQVYAEDLRGGVALVLAGLAAKGYTTVHNIEYVDRGYFKLENSLKKLGAEIKRI